MKKFLPWIFHHTNREKIYQPKPKDSVMQVMKINGHRMGIANCNNLRFRVHPYCRKKIGGLLRSSKEDREALKKCKALNNIKTNSGNGKGKKKKPRKQRRWKGSKRKHAKQKAKKRRRRKKKTVFVF